MQKTQLLTGLFLFLFACEPILSVEPALSTGNPDNPTEITTAEARARSQILETAYLSMLQNIHRNYFRGDQRLPVPSRVLEDVFFSVDRKNGIKSHWIAVNTPPMNVAHKPKEGFETRAAKALAGKQTRFEEVRSGVYYSARSVPLLVSCQRCHLNALAQKNGGDHVAGLVIQMPLAIPLKGDSQSSDKK